MTGVPQGTPENAGQLTFAPMEDRDHPTPPDCFLLEEIQTLQSFEKQVLEGVNYYIWHNQPEAGTMPHRFLYTLELVFDTGESLLLSSGDDSEAIRLITAENLVETAHRLQRLHGKPVIQRVAAGIQPVWREVVGKTLQFIRLSRNEAGLYLNDAILLDFGERRVLVRLSEREGLLAGAY
ncbi:MAG: hypothetical protein DYG98_13625 [Haliscomenobacteraceae bacterium CHB4]|nr:hypothetical protein [Saprospiraceae bacterium]MCE7924088.1 hypothetical protein [Haliscomenobacteraceae bacterium CHB4]